jgi:deoxycytidylate deaminase
MNTQIWSELQDFANKASGDRKTHVASCLVWPDGRKVFGANHLRDNHNLTEQEIMERVRPKFYDAMMCGEEGAINKATQLGLEISEAKLYSLLFPCPRCAEMIAKTKLKYIVAHKHRINQNGKFDNSLDDSRKIFDKAKIKYEIGEPDEQ